MLVSIIAAMDRRGLIGDETGLPWRLPRDLRRFRATTWGKPIILGRRTFELIGKPLPGRFTIVLTQNHEYVAPGCRVAQTFQEALALAADYLVSTRGEESMIIGGGKVYEEAIQRWDRAYLTVVEGEFTGSSFFPVRELLRQNWKPACAPETHPADAQNPHGLSFHILDRARDPTPPRCPDLDKAWEQVDLAALLTRGTPGA